MQGCSELVHKLHNYKGDLIPRGKNWESPFEFLWENDRDGRLKNASVQDIWIVLEGPGHVGLAQKNARFMPVLQLRHTYLQSHDIWTISVDSDDRELLHLREIIGSVCIEDNVMIMDENDVDFNFENVERKELYVHMACSRLRNIRLLEDWEKIGDGLVKFLIAVFTKLREESLLQKLFDQKNAQGRTILQIFVLCFFNSLPNKRNLFDLPTIETGLHFKFFLTLNRMLEILPEECINARNKAGRTVLHWAVAHDCQSALTLLSKDNTKAKFNLTFDTQYLQHVSPFQLLLFHDLIMPSHMRRHSMKEELTTPIYCEMSNFKMIVLESEHLMEHEYGGMKGLQKKLSTSKTI